MIADGRTITSILLGIEEYPSIGDTVTVTMSGEVGLGILLTSITAISIITGEAVSGVTIMD